MTRMSMYLPAFLSLLIMSAFGYKDYSASKQLYFVVEMDVSANGISQVFFDTGHGARKQKSSKLKVQSRGLQKYSFSAPKSIKSIRFDPIDRTSVVRIKSADIENADGGKLKIFPIQSFRAIQQISRMNVSNDVLTIQTTENANDPITVIDNSTLEIKTRWLDFFAHHGWKYVGYAFLSFFFLLGLAKCRPRIVEVLDRLLDYGLANPKKAITFIGGLGVVLSCYPVVFFDKSFISPAGVAALYDGPPWVPGFSFNGDAEDFRGSDLGATLWSIAPNSVVQHDSLFRYFEFPFWNRYVGAGIPLFAQGYSLIGDVLHWIPVFLDGSAIGWDIKFVLSKAIFAIGMGLLVFRLTGTLLAGSLIAFSSCFLGFFAYRFNHPAFFVLTYLPWVVIQWDRLGKVLALPKPSARDCVAHSFLLAVVTWLQLNAGTPKEGVISACFVQTLGVLAFCVTISKTWGWLRSFAFACGIGFSLVMIAAPYWLLFLDALGKAFTAYDTPGISSFQPKMIIGFFDNFFFQAYFNNRLLGPSVNLFVLFCMTSSFLSLRQRQSSLVYVAWCLFSVAMATAYGLIPVSILIEVPFVNKIQHIGNTFSVPMLALSLVIAGYGIRDYLEASEKVRKRVWIVSILIFLGTWLVLNSSDPINVIMSVQYGIVFLIAIVVFILLGSYALPNGWKNKEAVVLLTICFLIVHVRHGMHLLTGVKAIDAFVMNPTQRANFAIKSSAIEFVRNEIDKAAFPTRVIGEKAVLFPGFNARFGLEGIVPVEALRNKYYDKLLAIVDYPVAKWSWCHLISNDQIFDRAASLDLLGIGYIVATPGTNMPEDMKLVHSSDLDVWKRESVWPRAFFVNNIIEVHNPSDILDALTDKTQIPFAAVETQLIPRGVINNNMSYQVLPASEYKLTNNSTQFSVEASGPGIIVLGETYYPGDFVAKVNGVQADYIRVNESSKGIWVNKAGKYDVSFTYRPEKLNPSLWISLFGLASLPLLISMSIRFPRSIAKNEL